MKVALAQINPTVGDIQGNTARIVDRIVAARSLGARLVAFGELAVTGYPPQDLLLRSGFVESNLEAVGEIAAHCTDVIAVVGFVDADPDARGKGLFNAAAVCGDGKITQTYRKRLLPTYNVFEEARHFDPGGSVETFSVGQGSTGAIVGLSICEDLWNDAQFDGRCVYGIDPIEETFNAGADFMISLSAVPFSAGRGPYREELFAAQARRHGKPILVVNQVGANDELIFEGASLVLDGKGQVAGRAKLFEEDLLIVDLADLSDTRVEPYPDPLPSMRRGIALGIHDYLGKCGFGDVLLGLSGGIDSAVTAAVAVEALGAGHVRGVAMPSRYSSEHSLEDAQRLANNLGIELEVIPIEPAHRTMEETLGSGVMDGASDLVWENLQARIRGQILMAASNASGALLLATGNKSELATGYCTLYGDMCGSLAVLGDVLKTDVYALAAEINASAGKEVIPNRTIKRAPSAELREGQSDQDSLPPYEVLDAILREYVEKQRSPDEIISAGFDASLVQIIAGMVNRAEYKRRQAAVVLRVSGLAFGCGRHMPIAAKFDR